MSVHRQLRETKMVSTKRSRGAIGKDLQRFKCCGPVSRLEKGEIGNRRHLSPPTFLTQSRGPGPDIIPSHQAARIRKMDTKVLEECDAYQTVGDKLHRTRLIFIFVSQRAP